MSITKNQFIQYYAQQAKKEDTSLFIGAGISASTGYPSWKSLLQPCANQLGIEITDSVDLYLLAQYYANQFGYSALKRIINENINLLIHESSLVNELLNLNFKSIWTTNYDTVLEKNYFKRNILTNSVYNDKDLANISRSNRVNIYKLNGDISNLDQIVITKNDLESYEKEHELLLTFFKRELVATTFLFLGYSFTDKVVLSCLNTINRCLKDSANYHFAVLKKDESKEFECFVNDLETRYSARVLLIDDFDDLPSILRELNYEIKRKNIFFSGVFERLPYDEDLFAQSVCSELSNVLLKNHFKLYTGYGRNFGNYLAGSSIQFLLSNNLNIDKNIIMRPFLQTMSSDDKKLHREMLINDCNIAIFMFGQSPENNIYINSTGMLKEFEIAKEMDKYIVPIGSSGYTAYEIWKDVKSNITEYPYLEKYIDLLNTKDINVLVSTILQILRDVC